MDSGHFHGVADRPENLRGLLFVDFVGVGSGAVGARAHADLRGRVGHGANDGNGVFEVRFDFGEVDARRDANQKGKGLAAIAFQRVGDLVQHGATV